MKTKIIASAILISGIWLLGINFSSAMENQNLNATINISQEKKSEIEKMKLEKNKMISENKKRLMEMKEQSLQFFKSKKEEKKQMRDFFMKNNRLNKKQLELYVAEIKKEKENIKNDYKKMILDSKDLSIEEKEKMKQMFILKMKEKYNKIQERMNYVLEEQKINKEKKLELIKKIKKEKEEYKTKIKATIELHKNEKKEVIKKFKKDRFELRLKYKKIFAKKLGNRLDKISDEKIKKILERINKNIFKVKLNSKMPEIKREKLLAQLWAIEDILKIELEKRNSK